MNIEEFNRTSSITFTSATKVGIRIKRPMNKVNLRDKYSYLETKLNNEGLKELDEYMKQFEWEDDFIR